MEAIFFVIDIALMIMLVVGIRKADRVNKGDELGLFGYIEIRENNRKPKSSGIKPSRQK